MDILEKFKKDFQKNWVSASDWEKNKVIDYLDETINEIVQLKKQQMERLNEYERKIRNILNDYSDEEYKIVVDGMIKDNKEEINDYIDDEIDIIKQINNCNSGVYTKYLIYYYIKGINPVFYTIFNEDKIIKGIKEIESGKCNKIIAFDVLAKILILRESRSYNYPERLKQELDRNFKRYEDVCEA